MPGPQIPDIWQQPPKTVAQYDPSSDEWSILIDDQWVRLDYLIDSLVEMRSILKSQFSNFGNTDLKR